MIGSAETSSPYSQGLTARYRFATREVACICSSSAHLSLRVWPPLDPAISGPSPAPRRDPNVDNPPPAASRGHSRSGVCGCHSAVAPPLPRHPGLLPRTEPPSPSSAHHPQAGPSLSSTNPPKPRSFPGLPRLVSGWLPLLGSSLHPRWRLSPLPPPQKASGRKQTFPYWPARQPWGLLSLVFPSPGRPWTSVRPTSSAIQDDCGTGQPPQDTVDELLSPWTDSPVSCFQCPPPSVAGPRRYRPLRAPTRCLSVCLPPLTKPRRSSFPTLIPSAVRLHPPFNAPLSPIPAHRGSVTQLIYPCPYLVPLSPLSR